MTTETTPKNRKLSLITAALISMPVVMHYASRGFIHLENAAISQAYEISHYALQSVGLQPIPSQDNINVLIDRSADKYGLKRSLLHALATTESHKNPAALSLKGAIGVVQVMPANYKRCGLAHPGKLWDEATNIDCGAKILSEELTTYKGNLNRALQAYNGGPKAIDNYPESKNYATKVTTLFAQNLLSFE